MYLRCANEECRFLKYVHVSGSSKRKYCCAQCRAHAFRMRRHRRDDAVKSGQQLPANMFHRQCMAALFVEGKPCTPTQVAARLKVGRDHWPLVRRTLQTLCRSGLVARPARGLYTLPAGHRVLKHA